LLAEKVMGAKESLSIQLETATRQNNLKVEKLESDFREKTDVLSKQREELEENRNELREEIAQLADLKSSAEEIKRLRDEIESRQSENQHRLVQLEEEFRTVEFEKLQKTNAIRRQQQVEISELETQHKKNVLQTNQQAARDILVKVGMMPVKKKDWEKMKSELGERQQESEKEILELRAKARDEFLKEFNITFAEPQSARFVKRPRNSKARSSECASISRKNRLEFQRLWKQPKFTFPITSNKAANASRTLSI